ncbi:hypothetical protein B0T26DRAFT_750739 [Lasiosphaeria miniovina]|uniref:Ankyrin repeat protein n=1 Tax=Lasiosphaeria miniovina TaxID=1954250 RepID=A0AA40E0J4_9PEZI|nr:uncharacterized protein B0T26DRAFT_750739 [Lasiosphaeria miniovina]KAK0723469.1 hypothetical protein B0T26DRAFT_750739 [Lasiosphaeria miniovina]
MKQVHNPGQWLITRVNFPVGEPASDGKSTTVLKTPLQLAAIHGRVEIARWLADSTEHINAGFQLATETHELEDCHLGECQYVDSKSFCLDRPCRTALHFAIEKDNVEIARILLQEGASLRTGNPSPLCYAVRLGRDKIVRLMLGMPDENKNGNRSTPGFWATSAKDMLARPSLPEIHGSLTLVGEACRIEAERRAATMLDLLAEAAISIGERTRRTLFNGGIRFN